MPLGVHPRRLFSFCSNLDPCRTEFSVVCPRLHFEGSMGKWFQTRSFMMMCLTRGLSVALAIALLASTAAAADTVASGKVKSIDAANKTFILTDAGDKDSTFKLGAHLVVNRAGK